MIPADEQARLLEQARVAIATHLGAPARLPARAPAPRRAGAFVTLHLGGRLRGCIGHVEPDRRLDDVVRSCAVAAATEDPRFPPLTPEELPRVSLEISVLGPLEPVQRLEQVVVGRHGLVVEQGRRRGLLLPQVATDWGWDPRTFVQQTCRKAGLPADAWPGGGATLYRFEADVFGEPSSAGDVPRA